MKQYLANIHYESGEYDEYRDDTETAVIPADSYKEAMKKAQEKAKNSLIGEPIVGDLTRDDFTWEGNYVYTSADLCYGRGTITIELSEVY